MTEAEVSKQMEIEDYIKRTEDFKRATDHLDALIDSTIDDIHQKRANEFDTPASKGESRKLQQYHQYHRQDGAGRGGRSRGRGGGR